MNDLPPYRRPVNTVFQRYALFPHLTVGQNIAFGLISKKTPKKDQIRMVREMLEMVQLSEIEHRSPVQLSGGQQQRVALARALVNEPEVLLLDEPLNALDLKLRKQMQLELKHLQTQTETTFIYVTHDQEEALTMSNRIAVMNKGRILQVGTPREVYEKPANRFVASFIGESNFFQGKIEESTLKSVSLRLWNDQVVSFSPEEKLYKKDADTTLMIRPEKLRLASQKPTDGDEIALPGNVVEAVYAGDSTQYMVNLKNGENIKIRTPNANGSAKQYFDPGNEVSICFSANDLRIVEAE